MKKNHLSGTVFLKALTSTGLEKSAIVVLQGLMKLRQISNHPVMAYDDYASGSGKFETVLQDMESVISEGHKILVFSSFVKHLDLYAAELEKKKNKVFNAYRSKYKQGKNRKQFPE